MGVWRYSGESVKGPYGGPVEKSEGTWAVKCSVGECENYCLVRVSLRDPKGRRMVVEHQEGALGVFGCAL